MKKVLIFYISEFGGHNKAARNIREALLHRNPDIEVKILNGFSYFYPYWEKIIDFLYTLVIKHIPNLWGNIYDKESVLKKLNPIRRFVNQRTFNKLDALIDDYSPDCVIATQAFPCGIFADFKMLTGVQIPLIAAVTDYHPHRFWIHPAIDVYTVACLEAKQFLIQQGVVGNKIEILGIPISLEFSRKYSKKDVALELGFNPDIPTVLIMGGGLGIGPIEKVAKQLDKLDCSLQLIAICGRNKKIYRWFKRNNKYFSKPIFYYSYINCVNKIMDFIDIIITKGGGITTSESLAKGLAIIITSPIPGQEERNVKFLLGKDAIIEANTPEEITKYVKELFENKDKMNKLKIKAKEIAFVDSSLSIADLVLGMMK